MAAQRHIKNAPERMRRSVLSVLIVTVLLATLATFFGAQRYFQRLETQTVQNRMALYLRALNETLRQHQHLPFVLARDPRYSDALVGRGTQEITNQRLNTLAREAKLEAIYLMDATGDVVATSNAGLPHSFLSQNYGFRPYFQEALNGKCSDYFAIGATSGRPGYFVAEAVTNAVGDSIGVIAIKLDVSELQRSWESNRETVVAINKDGIVVLASNADWLYRPAHKLDAALRNEVLASRQFGTQTLVPLDWRTQAEARVFVAGTSYIVASGRSDWREWSVHYLLPQSAILRQTLVATAFFGSIIALLVGFATFLRSRRIEQAFTISERQRAELLLSNEQLEKAQSDLARSAKLAALGHLAGSVTHELGQPISAFRNHLAAAEIGNEITSPTTALNLNRLVDRMEAITKQFRYFARGHSDQKKPVDLARVLREAENLLAAEIASAGISFQREQCAASVQIHAHQIQLEQAFTNLFKNAVQAVTGLATPQIDIKIRIAQQVAVIRVCDNGSGLGEATLSELQELFFTTKPSGEGMGLGLAITTEIIRDHGGDLSLGTSDIGAEFVVTLPIYTEGNPV